MIRFFADRKMDPDAVKSTLSNLAFGNVIAAAARDYKKVWSLKLSSFFYFLKWVFVETVAYVFAYCWVFVYLKEFDVKLALFFWISFNFKPSMKETHFASLNVLWFIRFVVWL
jgi:hypothetical protein